MFQNVPFFMGEIPYKNKKWEKNIGEKNNPLNLTLDPNFQARDIHPSSGFIWGQAPRMRTTWEGGKAATIKKKVYLPTTWMVDFHGFHVGKCTFSSHGCYVFSCMIFFASLLNRKSVDKALLNSLSSLLIYPFFFRSCGRPWFRCKIWGVHFWTGRS